MHNSCLSKFRPFTGDLLRFNRAGASLTSITITDGNGVQLITRRRREEKINTCTGKTVSLVISMRVPGRLNLSLNIHNVIFSYVSVSYTSDALESRVYRTSLMNKTWRCSGGTAAKTFYGFDLESSAGNPIR